MLGEGGEVQLLLLLILLGGAPSGGSYLLLVALVRLCRARRCSPFCAGAPALASLASRAMAISLHP